MTEREPTPTDALPETPRPSYEQLGQGLTALLTGTGCGVREGFPESHHAKGTMFYYDYGTRSLVLHPWISPRGRVEALLHETVDRLSEKRSKKRKKEWREEPRRWAVETVLSRRWGLSVERDDEQPSELTPAERGVVDRIAAAVETIG